MTAPGPDSAAFCAACAVYVPRALSEADLHALRAFVARTESTDLRRRFGGAVQLDTDAAVRRFFWIDSARGETGLVRVGDEEIVGVSHRVRIARDAAEFALLVRSDRKRQGLGAALMRCMICRSRREALAWARGAVAADNHAVLGLARRFGFVRRGPFGPVMEFELRLGPEAR